MADRIQIRRGTAAEWALSDPILAEGELGYEKDTNILKAGDAVNTWSDLPNLFTGGSRMIHITHASFTDATNFNHASIVGKDLAIFLNGINRFLESSEWEQTLTGMNILLEGFDATANEYSIFITENLIEL